MITTWKRHGEYGHLRHRSRSRQEGRDEGNGFNTKKRRQTKTHEEELLR